jgi:predicted Co/Zn/Cd cation transporter (cation efflux family)
MVCMILAYLLDLILLYAMVNAIRYLFRKGEHVPVENAIADRLEKWWRRHSGKSGENK